MAQFNNFGSGKFQSFVNKTKTRAGAAFSTARNAATNAFQAGRVGYYSGVMNRIGKYPGYEGFVQSGYPIPKYTGVNKFAFNVGSGLGTMRVLIARTNSAVRQGIYAFSQGVVRVTKSGRDWVVRMLQAAPALLKRGGQAVKNFLVTAWKNIVAGYKKISPAENLARATTKAPKTTNWRGKPLKPEKQAENQERYEEKVASKAKRFRYAEAALAAYGIGAAAIKHANKQSDKED